MVQLCRHTQAIGVHKEHSSLHKRALLTQEYHKACTLAWLFPMASRSQAGLQAVCSSEQWPVLQLSTSCSPPSLKQLTTPSCSQLTLHHSNTHTQMHTHTLLTVKRPRLLSPRHSKEPALNAECAVLTSAEPRACCSCTNNALNYPPPSNSAPHPS